MYRYLLSTSGAAVLLGFPWELRSSASDGRTTAAEPVTSTAEDRDQRAGKETFLQSQQCFLPCREDVGCRKEDSGQVRTLPL